MIRFGEVCAGISSASVALIRIDGEWVAREKCPSGADIFARGRTKADAMAALDDTRPRMSEIAASAYGLLVIDGGR